MIKTFLHGDEKLQAFAHVGEPKTEDVVIHHGTLYIVCEVQELAPLGTGTRQVVARCLPLDDLPRTAPFEDVLRIYRESALGVTETGTLGTYTRTAP